MPKYIDLAGTAGEQVLGAIETAQDAAVSAVTTAVTTVGNVIPSVKTITLPDAVPTASEVAETTFDFIERVVASQKKITLGLIGAFKPLAEKVVTTSGNGAAK